MFGVEGFAGDREGIAIYARTDGTGYLICTDQIAGNTHYHLSKREGGPAGPNDHSKLVKRVRGGADSTDGIEVTSAALGGKFPSGLLIAMNCGAKNFLVFRWEDVRDSCAPKLRE